jgi:hypothetical protein
VAEDFVPLLTGLDLRGWKADPGHVGHWRPRPSPNTLAYDGKSHAKDRNLWTEKEYGNFELICDWHWTAKPAKRNQPVILPTGDEAVDESGKVKQVETDYAGNTGIILRGSPKSRVKLWCNPIGSGEVLGYASDKNLPVEVRRAATPKARADAPLGKWNRTHLILKGDRLTVKLNGQTVIDNAELPGLPPRGPIGLQDHGEPVEFANLFVRELN